MHSGADLHQFPPFYGNRSDSSYNKYIFDFKKKLFKIDLENGLDSQWISSLNYSETQEKGL